MIGRSFHHQTWSSDGFRLSKWENKVLPLHVRETDEFYET